jgi:hypothetical protein
MRYFIQIAVMLGDVAIVLACAYVVSCEPRNLFVWIIVALTVNTWLKQGGFEAWHPKVIRQFLAHAKKIGL